MRTHDLAWIAEAVGGRLVGAADTEVGPDVVIDTRKATPGCLFVALPGERVDGHDFVQAAASAGAAAAMVSREVDAPLPQVVVPDGIEGLTRLARAVVAQEHPNGLKVLAITGSSGKTSTKDILAQVLEVAGPTVSPIGSFNNEIGVPLTACAVGEGTRHLVSEMGARGSGHITWLCDIVHPDISLALNVGTAHLGEFGSVEGIAAAKGEIVEALGPQGWAVLNLDDDHVSAMAGRTQGHVAWFSTTDRTVEDAEVVVRAVDQCGNDLQQFSFTLVVDQYGQHSEHAVHLPLIGAHQVANAVAAAAGALVAGVAPQVVATALNELEHRSPWRMELQVRPDGAAIINDAYNANPDSMRAALTTLGQIGGARRRLHPGARVVAVLGDMLELGGEAAHLHHEVGMLAARVGVDEVHAIGGHAEDIAAGARAGGIRARVTTVEQASTLGLGSGDVILVKASRGLALERVAAALQECAGAAGAVK